MREGKNSEGVANMPPGSYRVNNQLQFFLPFPDTFAFKSYLSQCDTEYIDLEQIFSDSARYRSFKLNVHKEQYVLCFNSEL